MLAPITGGKKIAVPLGPRGVEFSSEDGVQIEFAGATLSPEKKFIYTFQFSDKKKRALRRVRVEDVSDEIASVMVDDNQPALDQGRWHGTSRPFEKGEPTVAWMVTVTNTLRVFRFTVTFADGREVGISQGAMFPAGLKAGIRAAWGENY
jgi:hypothetical protein